MPIPIYSPTEIDAIAHAGAVVWRILGQLTSACRPGVITREIDALARELLTDTGARSLAPEATDRAGRAFPGVCCVSVNEEVVHAVPSERIIREGDVVCVDLAARVDGWCADACRSVVVGEGDAESVRLAQAARDALTRGLALCEPGRRWSQVATAIRAGVSDAGFRLVTGLAGHGIGRSLHEPPTAWLASDATDFVLRPGMALTIEPVLTTGSGRTLTLDDGWTVLSADRRPAAGEERTVAITREGARVLTGPDQKPPGAGDAGAESAAPNAP